MKKEILLDDWLNIYKKDISKMCLKFCGKINNNYEYNDLFQQAQIILMDLHNNDNMKGKNYVLTYVKGRLIDYMRSLSKKENYNKRFDWDKNWEKESDISDFYGEGEGIY